ncbi:MAG: ferritin family protein [Sulfuritalea sp.]|jgi:rubrerythrin|nr:ferritin family protein [Sulfuritalea sp.]
MSGKPQDGGAIRTLPELLAHALAMENEAAERYGELADQMETHHKTAVAAIFRRLEKAEKAHLGELDEMCRKVQLPHYAPWDFKWSGSESPEAIAIGRVNYQLSVREAILLAFEHERKAADFYAEIANTAEAADVKELARQFADEEHEHMGWLETYLAECGPDDSRVLEDPDPPLGQE